MRAVDSQDGGSPHSVEDTDELLMAVALHAAAYDLALQHAEGGELGIVGQLEGKRPASPPLF